jgi:hypothetical protein
MTDRFNAIRRTPPTAPPPRAPHEVDALIARAREHRLGLDFLLGGAHDAVAVTFGVHAFVVDAARERLRSGSGTGLETKGPSLR